MTNFERLISTRLEVVKEALSKGGVIRKNDMEFEPCPKADCYGCSDCAFDGYECNPDIIIKWLDERYKGPGETFECDDLVEVSDNGSIWRKRYYARYNNGNHYCWSEGRTSKTTYSIRDVISWKYIKKCEQ